MQLGLIFVLFLYRDYNSALAVDDADINSGLSSELKAELDRQVSSVISTLIEKYENDISEMKTEMELQKQRIDKLEANEHVYKSIVANCQTNAERFEDDIENVVEYVAKDVASIDGSTQDRKIHHGIARSRKGEGRNRRNVGHEVAFYAYLTNDVQGMGKFQTFIFDNAVTNIGNAYDEQNGIFTVPVAGTYVLCVTLLGQPTLRTWGHFMVNGNILAKFDLIDQQQASQTIVVVLKHGDTVSVQNTAANKGIYGDGYSTFSGFLLYEDFTVAPVG